jgi:hypothetical protein
VYWIQLAEDRVKWRALVNKVMNLPLAENMRDFLIREATNRF